jgi:hypothetical protein
VKWSLALFRNPSSDIVTDFFDVFLRTKDPFKSVYCILVCEVDNIPTGVEGLWLPVGVGKFNAGGY